MRKKQPIQKINEEADSRLPLSMSRLNRIVILLFVLMVISLAFLSVSETRPTETVRLSLMAVILFLYSLAVISAAGFLFYAGKKQLHDLMISLCCAALFFSIQGTSLLLILRNHSLSSLREITPLLRARAAGWLTAASVPAGAGIVLLLISNLFLIRITGLTAENIQSLSLGFLGLAGHLLFMAALIPGSSGTSGPLPDALAAGSGFCICYLELMVPACLICGLLALLWKPAAPADYILIPGCKVWPDGTMSESLENRVKTALSYEKTQYRTWGRHAVFLPSGGKGTAAVPSEAAAMKAYLIDKGVPENRIITEDSARTTYQNFLYSKQLLASLSPAMSGSSPEDPEEKDPSESGIIFCSNDYHLLRCCILADRLGFPVRGIACRSHWYLYANACLREYLALLLEGRVQHLVVLLFLIIGTALPQLFLPGF